MVPRARPFRFEYHDGELEEIAVTQDITEKNRKLHFSAAAKYSGSI